MNVEGYDVLVVHPVGGDLVSCFGIVVFGEILSYLNWGWQRSPGILINDAMKK